MISTNDLMMVVGYLVCFVGGVAFIFYLIGLGVSYCWQKYWDFDAFVRVCKEARRQGVKLCRNLG